MVESLVKEGQPSSPYPQSERTPYKDTWGKEWMSSPVTGRIWRIVTVSVHYSPIQPFTQQIIFEQFICDRIYVGTGDIAGNKITCLSELIF